MAGLVRLTSVWTGFAGAPGYTNMYAHHNGVSAQDVADEFADDIKDFWDVLNSFIPDDVTITVDPTWVSIAEASGNIQAEGSVAAPPAGTVGLYAGAYAGNSGVAVDWHTDTFIDGHRLKGRSYLVPFCGLFSGAGNLDSVNRQAVIDAAVALLTGSATMVVWHRPKGAVAGSYAQVTGATVSNRGATLRSRSI